VPLQTVGDYQKVFREAYAKTLGIPESRVDILKVSCGGRALPNSSSSSGSSAAAPRPSRHRALLQSLSNPKQGASYPSFLKAAAPAPAGAPAALNTVFKVPAPADPAQQQEVIEAINRNSGQALGPPLTILFEHPVEVEPPVLLQGPEGTTKQVPLPQQSPEAEPEPSPAPEEIPEETPEDSQEEEVASPEPSPMPSPSPVPTVNASSTNGTEGAPAAAVNGTILANETVPAPNGTEEANVTESVELLPTPGVSPNPNATEAPLVPSPAPSPSPLASPMPLPASPSPAPSNASKPSPPPASPVVEVTSPVPVYMPPAPPAPIKTPRRKSPQQESWEKAPPCAFEPTNANSTPDRQGRLWGWIDGHSCAFKSVTGKVAITVTWDTAVTCNGDATTGNSVYDGNGRLWGWQDNRSCAFRGQQQLDPSKRDQKLVTWETAPACKGIPWGSNAVRGADGQLWGYEDGKSCAFRHPQASQAVTWAAAPPCVGAPHYYKPVRDSFGRLWGWENGRSCRF